MCELFFKGNRPALFDQSGVSRLFSFQRIQRRKRKDFNIPQLLFCITILLGVLSVDPLRAFQHLFPYAFFNLVYGTYAVLFAAERVDFIDQEQDSPQIARHQLIHDKISFAAAERAVMDEHHDHHVQFRDDLLRDTAHPLIVIKSRRIYNIHSVLTEFTRIIDDRFLHLCGLGFFFFIQFGHIVREIIDPYLHSAPVPHLQFDMGLHVIGHPVHGCGGRKYIRRHNLLFQKRIDHRTLSSLEFTQNPYGKLARFQFFSAVLQLFCRFLQIHLLCDLLHLHKACVYLCDHVLITDVSCIVSHDCLFLSLFSFLLPLP